METLVPHLVAALIYLSQIYSHYTKGDRSPLKYREMSHVLTLILACYGLLTM